MTALINYLPYPANHMANGARKIANPSSFPSAYPPFTKYNIGDGRCAIATGLLHILYATLLTYGAGQAGRHFRYGFGAASVAGALISVPTYLLSLGGRHLIEASKLLVASVRAKSISGVGLSACWLAFGTGITYGASWTAKKRWGLGENLLVTMPAQRLAQLSAKVGL